MLLQLFNLNLLFSDPSAFFVKLIVGLLIGGTAILVAITVHEFSHAWASNYLGDPTAKRLGRVSLNPIVHLDPLGTLFILLAGFGWGKPVPVNPYALRGGMVKGGALVSFAGPLSNLILAAIVALVFRFGLIHWFLSGEHALDSFFLQLIFMIITFNIILAIFNLLPIAPLDGFKVAIGILPKDIAIPFARTEQYGMAILIMLLVFDRFSDVGILSWLLGPAVSGTSRLLLGF